MLYLYFAFKQLIIPPPPLTQVLQLIEVGISMEMSIMMRITKQDKTFLSVS